LGGYLLVIDHLGIIRILFIFVLLLLIDAIIIKPLENKVSPYFYNILGFYTCYVYYDFIGLYYVLYPALLIIKKVQNNHIIIN